jgi:hypothetical protein
MTAKNSPEKTPVKMWGVRLPAASHADFKEQLGDIQGRRNNLAQALNELGTLVLRRGQVEEDPAVAPVTYTRQGVTEWVFPPQPDSHPIEGDDGAVLNPTPGYTLTEFEERFCYHPRRVTGHLRLEYDDSGIRPRMSVSHVDGKSEFPEAVRTALAQAYEGLRPELAPTPLPD